MMLKWFNLRIIILLSLFGCFFIVLTLLVSASYQYVDKEVYSQKEYKGNFTYLNFTKKDYNQSFNLSNYYWSDISSAVLNLSGNNETEGDYISTLINTGPGIAWEGDYLYGTSENLFIKYYLNGSSTGETLSMSYPNPSCFGPVCSAQDIECISGTDTCVVLCSESAAWCDWLIPINTTRMVIDENNTQYNFTLQDFNEGNELYRGMAITSNYVFVGEPFTGKTYRYSLTGSKDLNMSNSIFGGWGNGTSFLASRPGVIEKYDENLNLLSTVWDKTSVGGGNYPLSSFATDLVWKEGLRTLFDPAASTAKAYYDTNQTAENVTVWFNNETVYSKEGVWSIENIASVNLKTNLSIYLSKCSYNSTKECPYNITIYSAGRGRVLYNLSLNLSEKFMNLTHCLGVYNNSATCCYDQRGNASEILDGKGYKIGDDYCAVRMGESNTTIDFNNTPFTAFSSDQVGLYSYQEADNLNIYNSLFYNYSASYSFDSTDHENVTLINITSINGRGYFGRDGNFTILNSLFNGSTGGYTVFFDNGIGMDIEDLTILNSSALTYHLYLDGTKNSNFNNITIKDSYSFEKESISLWASSSYNNFSNIYISGNGGKGFQLQSGQSLSIKNVSMENVSVGIYDNGFSPNSTFSNISIYGATQQGIYIQTDENTLENLSIFNASLEGILVAGGNNVIKNNLFNSSGNSSIFNQFLISLSPMNFGGNNFNQVDPLIVSSDLISTIISITSNNTDITSIADGTNDFRLWLVDLPSLGIPMTTLYVEEPPSISCVDLAASVGETCYLDEGHFFNDGPTNDYLWNTSSQASVISGNTTPPYIVHNFVYKQINPPILVSGNANNLSGNIIFDSSLNYQYVSLNITGNNNNVWNNHFYHASPVDGGADNIFCVNQTDVDINTKSWTSTTSIGSGGARIYQSFYLTRPGYVTEVTSRLMGNGLWAPLSCNGNYSFNIYSGNADGSVLDESSLSLIGNSSLRIFDSSPGTTGAEYQWNFSNLYLNSTQYFYKVVNATKGGASCFFYAVNISESINKTNGGELYSNGVLSPGIAVFNISVIQGEGNFYEEDLTQITGECGNPKLTYPLGGEDFSISNETLKIRWESQSARKDFILDYALFYSNDSKVTWFPIGNVQNNYLVWNISSLPGGYFNLKIIPNEGNFNGTNNLSYIFSIRKDNGWICNNITICEYNNITSALRLENNTINGISLMEENYTYSFANQSYSFFNEGTNSTITIGRNNITLNCNGSDFVGNNTGNGIYINNSYDNKIFNCRIYNYTYGLVDWGKNNNITNNTIDNSALLDMHINNTNSLLWLNNLYSRGINTSILPKLCVNSTDGEEGNFYKEGIELPPGECGQINISLPVEDTYSESMNISWRRQSSNNPINYTVQVYYPSVWTTLENTQNTYLYWDFGGWPENSYQMRIIPNDGVYNGTINTTAYSFILHTNVGSGGGGIGGGGGGPPIPINCTKGYYTDKDGKCVPLEEEIEDKTEINKISEWFLTLGQKISSVNPLIGWIIVLVISILLIFAIVSVEEKGRNYVVYVEEDLGLSSQTDKKEKLIKIREDTIKNFKLLITLISLVFLVFVLSTLNLDLLKSMGINKISEWFLTLGQKISYVNPSLGWIIFIVASVLLIFAIASVEARARKHRLQARFDSGWLSVKKRKEGHVKIKENTLKNFKFLFLSFFFIFLISVMLNWDVSIVELGKQISTIYPFGGFLVLMIIIVITLTTMWYIITKYVRGGKNE